MSYEQVKDLPPAEFKRYRRVQPETSRRMVEVVSDHLRRKRRASGRPTRLPVVDQVLMTLEYRREYRTFFHIATSWGLHESSVWRTIRRVEDILTKSKAFKLPGKKKLQPSDHEIEFIVVDVAETPVERPKKSSTATTAGRRSGTR
jgi:Helix-turn-helix of DDE superfamily endonuclease